MFNKIWKKQIVKPSSKVGIFKPKQGFDLDDDGDKDCCEEARTLYKILWGGSVEEYDKGVAKGRWLGRGNLSCDEFKKRITIFAEKGWEIGTKVLNEWEECEKNV